MNTSEPVEQNSPAALEWIAGILNGRNIPFQVTGGLVARIYGSTRPLADIDIDVPDEYLPVLASLLTRKTMGDTRKNNRGT